MTKKKQTQTPISQEENAQAQQMLAEYPRIAQQLYNSSDRQQAETALADFNALPVSSQIALLKGLARQQQVEAADVLKAINELGTSKEVRKEAKRALIQLSSAKIYPAWEPPAELAPVLALAQPSTNPPRFWKGYMADARKSGEAGLLLAWLQGEDYREVRVISLLLEFWHDGVKDFFTEIDTKRGFEKLHEQMRSSLSDVPLKDCSLAQARRLLREALEVNTRHGTKPHRDYQLHLSLAKQLILEAPDIGEEEEGELDEEVEGAIDLHDLKPIEVVANFVELWINSRHDIAYTLLAQNSPLRAGLGKDEWVKQRTAWAERFEPAKLEPGLLNEREAPKARFWRPSFVKGASSPNTKEVEASWSIELHETPPADSLPELPAPTTSYAETGRYWFWASYTLVQEDGEWHIQSMTDEGAAAQNIATADLYARVEKLGNELEHLIAGKDGAGTKDLSKDEEQHYKAEISTLILRMLSLIDVLIRKSPLDRTLYQNAAGAATLVGQYERSLVYLVPLVERFPEQHGPFYQRIAEAQRLLSEQYFDDEDDERSERFEELAKQSLAASLAAEETFGAHMDLVEILVDDDEEEQLDEAEKHLLQAQTLTNKPADLGHIELHLGQIATARKDYQEALRHYQRMTELQPDLSSAWTELGRAHNRLGNSTEAEASYRHAIELNAEYIDPYAALALLYREADQKDKAFAILTEGVRANPDSFELYTMLTALSIDQEDYDRAEEFLEKAESIEPDEPLVQTYRQILTLHELEPAGSASTPQKFRKRKWRGGHGHGPTK